MPLFNNYDNCTIFFPSRHRDKTFPSSSSNINSSNNTTTTDLIEPPATGLLVHLTRLNVPCINGGYISFGDRNFLCGKLEDLSPNERTHYFPSHTSTSVQLHRHPLFRLTYKLVDYCYNVTLTDRNGTYYVQPKGALECYFRIHLPYGNRIELNLVTNVKMNSSDIYFNGNNYDSSSNSRNSAAFVEPEFLDLNVPQSDVTTSASETAGARSKSCLDGIRIELYDTGLSDWSHCVQPYGGPRKFNVISSGNTLVIRVMRTIAAHPIIIDSDAEGPASLFIEYIALPIAQLVSQCAFGWVAVQQLCVTAVDVALPWYYAEAECKKRGGHLAAIRNEREQKVIDMLLLNSSGYKDNSAYWIGASDKNFEGDFRWSNGFPFSYSNWFPGWSEHSNYNKQPNDDGLSGQDCVEIRRFFRAPPGIQTKSTVPLAPTYMWNDRDCSAKNYFLCERPMSDEPLEKTDWATGCNKTIFLTKDRPRASLWSPGFPRHYPDNTNCFTVVIAPAGYNIVLEFEELILENEPECSYDYLEIIDSKVEPISHASSIKDLYRKYLHRRRSGRSVPTATSSVRSKKPLYSSYNEVFAPSSAPSTQQQSHRNTIDGVTPSINRNNNISVNFFENFLNIYKAHSTVVLQIPKSNADTDEFLAAKALPHRVCGDWSSKLKLLRYVSSDALLGLHFTSDYSHHFSGYKAKVTIKNASSECPDERLKPYNGTCYLFVSYPEVDWQTAQSVCRGIGAQLASISSADEQRFIIGNIRNQLDYSPQAIYWLGGELAQNKEFEWVDGTDMSFLGWLPGQEVIDQVPHEPTCLGLQWKLSPTPMLPSGLYWTSQKCAKYGGYVCKSKKQKIRETYVQNKTITGSEGRLTSPGYPNTYPLNIDYWVKINGPERTRLIIQFQTIDLEQQEDCLYDYVSVQETAHQQNSNEYEPGTSTYPIAMFTSNEDYSDFQSDDSNGQDQSNMSSAQHEGDSDTRNWFHKDLERIKQNIQNSSVIKRDLKYFRKLQNVLQTEGDLQHEIRLLEGLRNKLIQHRRKKRYLDTPNQKILKSLHGNNPSFAPYVRWCGSHNANMSRFDFVSTGNAALLHFHSDYSLSGMGFSFIWNAIDVAGCPSQTFTGHEGSLASPNYPHFLLNNLDCSYVIQAATGKRVWLEFKDFQTIDDSLIDVDLGTGAFTPFWNRVQLNDGVFVSYGDKIVVRLRTGWAPKGRGFKALYRTMNFVNEEHSMSLMSLSYGQLLHLNYPQFMPNNINFTQHLSAPLGHVILLEIYGVGFSENRCLNGGSLEVYDNYADSNGTYWRLCEIHEHHPYPDAGVMASSSSSSINHHNIPDLPPQSQPLRHSAAAVDDDVVGGGQLESTQLLQLMRPSPVHITSYLNTLHVRQISEIGANAVKLNATVRIQPDINYKYKLASANDEVESCQPNPCQYGGKCISNGISKRCQCAGHYTGRFCGLNMCEVEPCLFGKCELTSTGFKCLCQQGYIGRTCDQKQKPCASNPCEGRGECFNKNGGYFCRCHAWWEGQRCERRMAHIPYKPLSDRMLQEPFWLGLITVFVVLAVIGLVWCAKRHFPEKIEKLLAEEAERNRPPGMQHGHHHHHQSLREQLQFTNSAPQSTATTPGAPRTIFGRLGIRKPSILSLSSPQPPGGATARTFSLDDLLRPPPRRTPSPRKKRNNSTPTKKNAAEKKQILQQLISPAAHQTRPKVSLDELIHMSENRLKPCAIDSENDIKETTFSPDNSASTSSKYCGNGGVCGPNNGIVPLNDAKLEKKVTFARLLSKVSAEMSSGSETTHTESALSLPIEISLRASSMPPSPCGHHGDARSPHSTSSNQGSDSLSSSDLMLPDIDVRFNNNRRMRSKVSSADSILTMFRNFASTNVSPMLVSPASSPTPSSPQDDNAGDDESSTSSIHTPVSYTSGGGPDSPVYYRQSTIEVPVLDLLSTQKTQSGYANPPTILLEIPSSINKCLSPIRELPTPMPSPALTPVMSRPQRFTRFCNSRNNISTSFSDDDEKMSIEQYDNRIRTVLENSQTVQIHLDSEDATGLPNRNTTKKLRLDVTPPSIHISIDIEAPTPGQRSPNRPTQLIIPQLVVEQASPIKERLPVMHLGSPPPQRQSVGETNFFAPQKQRSKLKQQSEKPASLDLPFIPPMITVTANMSDAESDADLNLMSPNVGSKNGSGHHLVVPTGGMCYLSPFSICTRGDRTISESNLSSSGYSSMASPGPSRCGSSNPLCPSEMEDPGTGGSGSQLPLHSLSIRRHGSLIKNCQKNSTGTEATSTDGSDHRQRSRSRSDSETLSDDVLLESNDEGIGTDHLDEKIEDGEIKSAKELELYIGKEMLDPSDKTLCLKEEPLVMSQLQLPLIVIQSDGNEKGLSPVSSRSESPLSERTNGMGRFSPLFYGRKDQQLPFTDSDGLYDFPSSDGKGYSSTHHSKKSSTKRRDRKSSRAGITQSPTKSSSQLEIPCKEAYSSRLSGHPKHHHHSPISTARKSPKRRSIIRHPVASSSSSSESIISAREVIHRPIKGIFNIHLKDTSVLPIEEIPPDTSSYILPKGINDDHIPARPSRKLNRLRAIGNQIRFLRRLEKSIKSREQPGAGAMAVRSPSSSDSCNNDDDLDDGSGADSPGVTSPLIVRSPVKSTVNATSHLFKPIGRQKRLANFYGTNIPWRSRERRSIHGGDINSD